MSSYMRSQPTKLSVAGSENCQYDGTRRFHCRGRDPEQQWPKPLRETAFREHYRTCSAALALLQPTGLSQAEQQHVHAAVS